MDALDAHRPSISLPPRLPEPGEQFAVSPVDIRVAGRATAFALLVRGDAWVALGTWDGFAVELEADHLVPEELSLQLATAIPDAYRRRATP